MQFGIHLVKQNVLTADQFVSALERQQSSRPQLGALAIESGKLTVKQVFQVLRDQADSPDIKFGQLAVSSGLLSKTDLISLLYHQSARVRPFAEIVVEMGFVSDAVVMKQLTLFNHCKREPGAHSEVAVG